MKKSFLILGFAAAALAVSCNKDDLSGNVAKVFEGDRAYVIVNINGVSASETRAEDEGFLAGDEHDVTNAYFYFYDSDGIYVTEGEAWNTTSGTAADGIEYAANSVVVLTGLTQKTYPSWVVTLLNRPEGFKTPGTLEEFATALGYADDALRQTSAGTTYYSMSTSSYDGSTQTPTNVYTSRNDGKSYYFATPVVTENFVPEEVEYTDDTKTTLKIPDDCKPIYIFVERLAAKVTVALNADGLDMTTSGGSTYCTLAQNVYEGGTQPVSENLYIRLDGWKLNATARQTAYVKDIDASWTADALGFTWNDPDNRRSYWGRSWFYGLGADDGSYPDDGSDGNTDSDEADDSAKARSPYVKYTSLSGDLNSFSSYSSSAVTYADAEYCAENCNTAEIEDIRTAVTSILIKATACLYDSEEGTYSPVSLIRHNGQIYTLDAYLDLAVSHIPSGYYYAGEGGEYVSLDRSCLTVDVENSLNGYVDVVAGSSTVYQYDDENGGYTEADITSLLEAFNATYGTDANYFNGGAMYYSIPIPHLNDNTTEVTDDETGETSEVPDEGYYGVVRNHWYLGTLNSLSKLGKGIANSAEVIVPLPGDETSYLPAEVNIIPWRYVYWDLDL